MDSQQPTRDPSAASPAPRGYSLVEVMMVTAISAVVFAGVLSAYIFLGRGLVRQGIEAELVSQSRQAL